MNKYKVKAYQDGNYAVYLAAHKDIWDSKDEFMFSGTLADCEAYIRLHEKGYI